MRGPGFQRQGTTSEGARDQTVVRLTRAIGLRLTVVAALLTLTLLVTACALVLSDREGNPAASLPPKALDHVMQSVVEVDAIHSRGLAHDRIGIGTGVVYNEDGLIVTNDHVLTLVDRGDPDEIMVILHDGTTVRATLVARFPDLDLAFIDAELPGAVPARFETDLDEVEPGDKVVAIGAPEHLEDPVMRGRVTDVLERLHSPQRPELRTIIETNLQLRQGYSGGPLLDSAGRVVGINFGTTIPGTSRRMVGLAIPAQIVVDSAERLFAPTVR